MSQPLNPFQERMEAHEKKMELLAEHYIGKTNLEIGRSLPDLWNRKMWYINRIFELGATSGRFDSAAHRCKSTTSKVYQKHRAVVENLRSVKEHLALELMDLLQ